MGRTFYQAWFICTLQENRPIYCYRQATRSSVNSFEINVKVYMQPYNVLRRLFFHLKDLFHSKDCINTPSKDKSNMMYKIPSCDYDARYVDETGWALKTQLLDYKMLLRRVNYLLYPTWACMGTVHIDGTNASILGGQVQIPPKAIQGSCKLFIYTVQNLLE